MQDPLARYRETRKAVERQRTVRTFLFHLVAYALGSLIFAAWSAGAYYLRGDRQLWFLVPLIFWGIGVIIHYWVAVALFDDWWRNDERLIEDRLRR